MLVLNLYPLRHHDRRGGSSSDSRLEGNGFELPVRGRGESDCRHFVQPASVSSRIEMEEPANKPHFYRASTRLNTADTEFDASGFDKLPQVDIVYAYSNYNPIALDAFVKAGAKGIEHAGPGDGTVGAQMVAAPAQRDMRRQPAARRIRARRAGAVGTPTGAECDGRPGAPWRCRGATSSPADRHEVVYANALHDEELARAIGLAVHVMRGLRRYRAALAGQEPVDVARGSRLDHHWPFEANETVADLAVVMPRYALPGRKAQHLDAQIGALGNQLTPCNRVIAAVARLHRCFPSSVSETLEEISRARARFLTLSRRSWQPLSCVSG